MTWNIYLSGEIHTEWRDEIKKEATKEKMNINFTEPVTNPVSYTHLTLPTTP